MIKYLGSKRTLLTTISSIIAKIDPKGSVIDLFSGTSRVGHALKSQGHRVISNDHNAYAATLSKCYVETDNDREHEASQLVSEFNRMSGVAGYFTNTFCEKSRFFMPKNGERIDAIREAITLKSLDPELEAVMLTSLMEAADRVDSTVGLQMAYLKQWAKRASNDLELRVPNLLPCAPEGKGRSVQMDAAQAVDSLEADIIYMDPPYNQHKYLGNYHIWESLVLWDKPEVYGVACKRVDCRDRSSDFNSKPKSREAFQHIITNAKAQHLVVSFSDEGYFTKADIEEMLSCRGEVLTFEVAYKRYVGSQIGIHNPSGEKVGVAGSTKNVEYIFVTSKSDAAMEILKTRA